LPHTHPDQRIFTVISGTFYAGVGTQFDETKLVALKPGSIMSMPAEVVHYAWAKDGDVIVQEVGLGPSGTKLWAPGAKQYADW
jgi:quercetin dioxygenase-like cupin family protein